MTILPPYRWRFFLSALLLGFISSTVHGATSNEIAHAIQDPGASNYQPREAANLFLWKAGQSAIPALNQAAQSEDTEVSSRAKQLLRDIHSDITPDTSPAIKELALNCIAAQALFKLHETNRCTSLLQSTLQMCRGDVRAENQILNYAIKTRNYVLAAPWCLSGSLPGTEDNSLEAVFWKLLNQKYAGDAISNRIDRYQDLLAGKLDLLETREMVFGSLEKLSTIDPNRLQTFLSSLCDFAEKWCDLDLALACAFRAKTILGDQNFDITYARLLLTQQRWLEAGESLKDNHSAGGLLLRGYAAIQLGRAEEGERLIHLAEIMPLSGDCGSRINLLRLTTELGLAESKKRQLELVRRTRSFFPDCDCEESWALVEDTAADGRFFEAAAIAENMLFSIYRGSSFYGNFARDWFDDVRDISDPSWVHEWRARGFLQENKLKEALHEIDICLRYLPGHVGMTTTLVTDLDSHAHKAEADPLFETVYSFLQKLSTDYPHYPQAQADLAQLSFNCHRHLDDAIDHARQAIDLDPENKLYRDTLAEMQNALNRK